jgi:hypothetical protein
MKVWGTICGGAEKTGGIRVRRASEDVKEGGV